MTLAVVASRVPLAARLDIMFPSLKADTPLYAQNRNFVTAKPAKRRCMARHDGHKKASRVSPARGAYPDGDGIRTRAGLRRRHQNGVDHMDHTVRLMDVRDRDRRGPALGIDDHHLAVRLL